MKKSVFVFALLLLGSMNFAQNITEAEAKEIFGDRFITTKEAGFTQTIEIPFVKKDLQYDRISWLIPINIDGKLQYRLIQARYLPNECQNNDTLNLNDAEEVIRILHISGKNFIDNESLIFFKTNDIVINKNGLEFKKAIACFSNNYSIVDLPTNTSVVLMGKHSISYILNDNNKTIISIDVGNNETDDEIIGFSVLTLINILN